MSISFDALHTLRASPVVGVGGSYATWNGIDEIVTVAAEVPSTVAHQLWKIEEVKGKEGIYTIVRHTAEGSSDGSWSLKDNAAVPHGPIIISKETVEWRIDHIKNGVSHAITIRPVTKAVGNDWYVGTDDTNQVVIKAFPIESVGERPYWQFKAHHHHHHPHH